MPKARTDDRLYRHYVADSGKFETECYAIRQLRLVPSAHQVEKENIPDDVRDVPAAWIGRPRAAELWTSDPDPDKAYALLLSSAEKDLETARGRLAVYENVYAKLARAERRPGDAGE